MSSAHTPGPWKSLPEEVDKAYVRIRGDRPGSRYKVANVLTPSYEGVHPREAEETRANARLIAASPELLSACIGLLNIAETGVMSLGAIHAARAAIAQATGASHEL